LASDFCFCSSPVSPIVSVEVELFCIDWWIYLFLGGK
jgi:hypothetical protein